MRPATYIHIRRTGCPFFNRFKEHYNAFKANSRQSKFVEHTSEDNPSFTLMENIMTTISKI
jgi:hypothetical protein